MAGMIEASDEITKVAADAWLANAPAIVGATPLALMIELRDGDKEPTNRPKAWARITLRHDEADTFAFGRRYMNSGTLYVSVFVLFSDASGNIAQRLGVMLSDAIRAHNGSVTFSRVRPQEAGNDGVWSQFNVLASFSYEQDN